MVEAFTHAVIRDLGANLLGVYLTGSLSYDAFEHRSSDIDLTVIVQRPVSQAELSVLQRLHGEMEGALGWGRGDEFAPKDEAVAFLRFVVSVVSGTELYRELRSELGAS